MKQFGKKILNLFLAFLMVVSVVLPIVSYAEGEGSPVETNNETTNVTITKFLVDSFPTEEQAKLLKEVYNMNTIGDENKQSEILSEINDKLGKPKTLDGVKFIVYKVKDQETYLKIQKKPGDYTSKAQIEKEENKAKFTEEKNALTSGGGKVNFDLKDGYYWVIEDVTANDNAAKDVNKLYESSVPFGIHLPVIGKDGNRVKKLFYYPKNTVGNEVTKEKTVQSENLKYTTIDNYKDITWYLQAKIKKGDLDSLTYLNFKDSLAEDNNFVFDNTKNNDLKVYVKDEDGKNKVELKKDTDFELKTNTDKNVEINLKQVDGEKEGYKKLEISKNDNLLNANKEKALIVYAVIHAKYADNKLENTDFSKLRENDFELKYSHNPSGSEDKAKTTENIIEKPKVQTGGKKFIKYAKKLNQETTENIALEGAKFFIMRHREVKPVPSITVPEDIRNYYKFDVSGDQYLAYKNGNSGETEWVDLKAGELKYAKENSGWYNSNDSSNKKYLVTKSSKKDGTFEIKGLEFSNYEAKMYKEGSSDSGTNTAKVADIKNTYKLLEYEAPKDYQLNEKEIEFDIDPESYTSDSKHLNKIVGDNVTDLVQRRSIENIKPSIPATGAIGRALFISLGITVMVVSTIMYRKKRMEV